MERYSINAGHGQMCEDGEVIFDNYGRIVSKLAPFTVHDQAIELLQEGFSPIQVEQIIIRNQHYGSDLTITITKE